MVCPICQDSFDTVTHIPIIGVCGHSVCQTCVSRHMNCPMCRRAKVFVRLKPNYQMLEVMEEFSTTQKEWTKEKEGAKNRPRCHVCSNPVDRHRARICQPCCLANGSITEGFDGDVQILNIQQVDRSVLCSDCFLEGTHEGHKSILLSPIKMRFFSTKEYGALWDFMGPSIASRLDSSVDAMKVALNTFKNPLKRLQHHGHLAGDGENFAEYLSRVKRQKAVVERVATDFEDQVKEHIEQLKEVTLELESVSNVCLEKSMPAVLVASFAVDEHWLGFDRVAVTLTNGHRTDWVHYTIVAPTVGIMAIPKSGPIAPGQQALVAVHRKTDRRIMAAPDPFSLTINYVVRSDRDLPADNSYATKHTLIVPIIHQ